jgi:hypothetical protein
MPGAILIKKTATKEKRFCTAKTESNGYDPRARADEKRLMKIAARQ